MVEWLERAGLRFVGKDETGRRMEVMSISCSFLFQVNCVSLVSETTLCHRSVVKTITGLLL